MRFFIDGSKKDLIESFFIFLIDRSFAVISSNEKFSFKKVKLSALYCFNIQFLPLIESEFIYYKYLLLILLYFDFYGGQMNLPQIHCLNLLLL